MTAAVALVAFAVVLLIAAAYIVEILVGASS